MSYQEKRTMVTLLVGLVVLVSYLIFVITRYQNGIIDVNNLKYWASTMLIFIGIGIGLTIITQILYHILFSIGFAIKEKIKNPDLSDQEIESSIKSFMVTDEMDRLVELKSLRIGFIAAGLGFVLGLILIMSGYSAALMMNTLFISFNLGSLFEGLMQLYYYKRGIKNV
jgi:hypothetical protein